MTKTDKQYNMCADRLEMVLKATRVGMWDWNVQTGELTFSARWAEIAGYELGELEGRIETWERLAHPDDLKHSEELLKRHFAGELPYYEFECRMRHKDGHWVWVLDRGMVVSRTETGDPLRMTGTHADITVRRTAEANERQARENFETLFNTVDDFLFVLDEHGCILHANATAGRLGYRQDELCGMSILLLHPEDHRPECAEILAAMLAGTADFCPVPLITRSGELIPVETRVTRGRWDGKPVLFGVCKDVTELKRSEEKFSEAFANSAALMAISRIDTGEFLDVNGAFLETTGYTREEVVGQTFAGLGLLDSFAWMRTMELISSSRSVRNVELSLRIKNGQFRQSLFAITPVQVEGEPCLLIVATDITARKQAEESLRQQTALLSSLLDSIPDIVFFKDQKGVYLGCNPPFAEFVGRRRDEIVGKTDYDLFSKEMADSFRSYDLKVMQENRARHNEETIRYPDGRPMQIDTFKAPLVAPDGQAIGLLGISRDITERKEAEEELGRRESYLTAIIENLPGLAWLKDKESRFLAVNEAFAASCGLQCADELSGKTDMDIWPAELAARYRSDDAAVMESRLPVHVEEPIADKAGVLWFETFKTPVLDSQGEVIGTVGYAQDITPRKETEERIRQLSAIQHELMQLATGFVNIPTGRQDEAINTALKAIGKLIGAGRSYLFTYDFTADTMSNTHEWCAEGISPEIDNLQNIPNALLSEWVSAHRQGRETHVPSVQALPPGLLREILEPQGIQSLITLPLMDGEKCLGFVGFDAVKEPRVWRDEEVSLLHVLAEMLANLKIKWQATLALKQLNRELVQAKNDAEAGARAKSMFLANMSHEIRTPLNAVLGYAQLMERDCRGCSAKQRSLPAIAKSGQHLLELVNNLLELVQADVKEVPLSFSDFDFHHLLESVRMMSDLRPNRVVSIETVRSPDLPQFLNSDQGKIRQVLINLIGNAAKFTTDGYIRIQAGVSARCDDGAFLLVVDVEDTGCGIEPDSIERIFDPFEQGCGGQKLGRGTGLGLPLSRRYAQALGGDVTVLRSGQNTGSVFRFTFKATPVAGAADTTPAAGAVPPVAGLLPGQTAPRILAVDDDPANLRMLYYMLQEVGFSVDAALSGKQAFEYCVAGRRYDLILMDKRMPDMDGIETMRKLRETPEGQTVPVVIITASGMANERDQMLSAGAAGYVSKPVSRERLLAEIRRITGVQYEYDSAAQAAQPLPVELTPADLQSVAPDLRQSMLDSVRLGNINRMRQLAEELSPLSARISSGLIALISRYDYDTLIRLLSPETKGTE